MAVFFIAKPSSIVMFIVETKWTFSQEDRGHKSLIGVSRGIGRPHKDTCDFLNIKYRTHDVEFDLGDIKIERDSNTSLPAVMLPA